MVLCQGGLKILTVYQNNGTGDQMADRKTEVNRDMRRIFKEHTGNWGSDETILVWWNAKVDVNS